MKIAIVHLARRQNPPGAFATFWKSYTDHSAGVDHDVILAWKNFRGVEHPRVPPEFKVRNVVLSDRGGDIDVYFKIAKMFEYDAFVFLNSWSEIRRDGWLKTMADALTQNVGMVGVFSSRDSHRDNIARELRLVLDSPASLGKKAVHLLYAAYRWMRYGRRTPPSPNFHVRTNGFMIRREALLKVRKPVIFDKMDAFKFESGDSSLTRQVQKSGYEIACLDEKRLISDNRVRFED